MIWLSEQPLVPGRSYLLKIGTRTVPATVTALKHRIDVDTLAHLADRTLGLNEIGFCNLSTAAAGGVRSLFESTATPAPSS